MHAIRYFLLPLLYSCDMQHMYLANFLLDIDRLPTSGAKVGLEVLHTLGEERRDYAG